jgi:hypothetical protein
LLVSPQAAVGRISQKVTGYVHSNCGVLSRMKAAPTVPLPSSSEAKHSHLMSGSISRPLANRAEIVAEHLHKGSRVFLEGRQRTESWDDKQSGGKKYRTYVYADKIEFLGEQQRDGCSRAYSA